MEIIKHLAVFISLFAILGCSNNPSYKTTETEIFKLLTKSITNINVPKNKINAREIIGREEIDKSKVPLLFVELQSGQNGILSLYPGAGIGQTWIGVDGATITLNKGILNASRGMGYDLMGGGSLMPDWDKPSPSHYNRNWVYLVEDDRLIKLTYLCNRIVENESSSISIFDINFKTKKFVETCYRDEHTFKNYYFVDESNIVRRANQFHSKKVGHILTERLERRPL